MEDDGFTTVRRSGRGRGNRSPRAPLDHKTSSTISYTNQTTSRPRDRQPTTEQKLEKVLAILETRRRQLLEEEGNSGKGKDRSFVASWTDQLAAIRSILRDAPGEREGQLRFTRIVCLGIGITSESRESQFQFILLDMLQEAFQIPTKEIWVYDPLFTSVEIRLLQSRGYQLIPKNECGKHELDPWHRTLVYMPHCPGKLYDAFVRQNWAERLLGASAVLDGEKTNTSGVSASPRAVLLANDFRGYVENLPRRKVEKELSALYRLTPHLSRIAFPSLPTSHIASNAFNSLVFQYICEGESGKVDWESKPSEGAPTEVASTEVIEGELHIEDHDAPPDEEELSRRLARTVIAKG